MQSKLTRLATVAAAITAASVATLGLGSSGALAGPPLGTNTLTPASGNTSTTFTLTPPSGASCTGSGASGYNWQTYIVDAGVDASTLTYASGPNAVAGHFVSPLYDSAGGNPVVDQNPSAAPVGLISGIPTMSFSSLAGFLTTPGAYKIGFACTFGGALDAGKYWETPITISNVTGSSFDYAFGSVPSAPTLASPLTAGDQTLAGSFTASPSTPATSGFTVTAHPTAGADVTLPVAAAGPFTLTGLTNGTSYAVTVVATNSVGNSAPSNSVSGTPSLAARPPITGLTASQISGPGVHLSWTAPTGAAPTNYTVVFTPSVTGSPFTVPAGTTVLDVTTLTDGTPYSIAVTANYAAAPTTGPTATTSFTYAGAIIIQDLTVVRPAGALILTQRCGVNGALPAEPATAAGFPATGAVAASANQTGTAPTTGAAPGGPADPQFPAYPFPSPAAYPTHCGVNLGTGSFITTGALAGQYYSANGFINEVTVSDNRDTGAAWTVNGTMGTFSNGSSTFSGSRLGWSPKVNSVTPSQVVTAGPVVDPSITNDNTSGLGTARVLATATAGSATGIATLDARLKLLIPVTAAAGTFTGALSLSAI